jgi:hypothetical protein
MPSLLINDEIVKHTEVIGDAFNIFFSDNCSKSKLASGSER